jgi:antitoxin component YwqK of YwqJK toxin-antitoxin module
MGLINRITGNRKSYFDSGELLSNTKINIRGNRHGIYEEFYKSGAIKLQTQYKDGIQYGETKSFMKMELNTDNLIFLMVNMKEK